MSMDKSDTKEITAPLLKEEPKEIDDNFRRLKSYQKWAFLVSFGGYFMAHFSRKCYSTVKKQLKEDAGYEQDIIGMMDTMFMATYAIGNILSGKMGDTFNPTTILSIGLFGSALCLLLMNVGIWLDIENKSEIAGDIFILAVYFLFGLFQSTGGPVGTAVMGNWFCDEASVKNRGLIFGLWTCHQYLGDITAAFCTAIVLSFGLPYWWALLIPAAANFLWAIFTLQLVADPADMGIVTEETRIRKEKLAIANMNRSSHEQISDNAPKPISYMNALQIPMVAAYAFAFGFFKLTNYVLFFWLPFFLDKQGFNPVNANLIASLYSFGMMPGGIIVGKVSDIFGGRRATVIGVFMTLLMGFLSIFALYSEKLSASLLLPMLFVMGILVGGPNNIITSAVAADLASHPSVKGNNKSLGTVTGLINGIGSITASIGLLAVSPLSTAFGWSGVWIFLILCTFTGTALMLPKIFGELKPSKEVEEPLAAAASSSTA